MDRARSGLLVAFVVAVSLAAPLTGCGGDGGPNPPPGAAPGPQPTTFRGNLAHADEVDAQETAVQVCIEGTAFCSFTDHNGQFVLVAAASGNIALIFSGVDFTARLLLSGVPMGALVTTQDIGCSTSSGRCTPQKLDVEAPMPIDVPLSGAPVFDFTS